MRINLLPTDLRPTRPSPVPYMPLGGVVAISVIWVITQLAIAAGARNVAGEYRQEFGRVSKEFAPTKEIPGKLEHAEAERTALRLKAAAVTVLTRNECNMAPILRTLAEATPKPLRLTGLSLDPSGGTATLSGYGAEGNADIEAAAFIRALSADKSIGDVFDNITLNACQNAKHGNTPVKEFSISLRFGPRFNKSSEPGQAVEAKETNGPKNRPKT